MGLELFTAISSNKRKSFFLIFLLALLTMVTGGVIAYAFFGMTWQSAAIGLGVAFIVSLIMSFVSYYSGDMITLALSHAREADRKEHRQLYNVVEEMSIASGLPMPRVFVIDDPSPNAFATGRNPQKSAVAVTTGLLEKLNRDELQGVIAHEMSHIGNYDILYAMLVGILVGTLVMLSDVALRSLFYRRWSGGRSSSSGRGGGAAAFQIIMLLIALLFIILAPVFAMMVQFAISRQREYLADATGAKMTRYPEGLASALEKIAFSGKRMRTASKATQHLFIVNPFKPTKKLNALMATHPPIEDRIARLRGM